MSSVARDAVRVVDLGTREYRPVLRLQRELAEARRSGALDHDVLLIVEHPHVVTLGRGADPSHVVASQDVLRGCGVDVVEVERGGDVTYHGPGQVVGYPILDLRAYRKDLHWYLRRLEEVCLRTLRTHGLAGTRVAGYTGVWTSGAATPAASEEGEFPTLSETDAATLVPRGDVRKIASIGVHSSRWVTRHGFAFNVTEAPLKPFEWIVPCGISGVRMTSLHAEGVRISLEETIRTLVESFGLTFAVPVVEVEPDTIAGAAKPAPT